MFFAFSRVIERLIEKFPIHGTHLYRCISISADAGIMFASTLAMIQSDPLTMRVEAK